MIIDLHCHTKATKGESNKRNIFPKDLLPILKEKKVEIASITNHNQFDYNEFQEVTILGVEDNILFFPGVELDVTGIKDERAHVIIVVAPENANKLNELFGKSAITDAKKFEIYIVDLINDIKGLDYLFISHYNKNPELSEESLSYVYDNVDNFRVFLEPSSFRSLSIFSNKGYSCIMGSDVTDWSKYLDKNNILPNLKLKIKSFKELILLAKKDKLIINTLLNRVRKTNLEIKLRRDKEKLPFRSENIELYDEINVIFGGKGSGKSKYLEFIKDALIEKGEAPVYYNSDQAKDIIDEYKKVKTTEFRLENINESLDNCDFSIIKSWKPKSVTSLQLYFDAVRTNQNKRNRKYIGIIERSFLHNEYVANVQNYKTVYDKINDFCIWFEDTDINFLGLSSLKYSTTLELLNEYRIAAYNSYKTEWLGDLSIKLSNNTFKVIKEETDIISDGISIPNTAGLEDMFSNYSNALIEIKAYMDFSTTKPNEIKIDFGAIEENKNLYLKTTTSPYSEKIKASIYTLKEKNITTLKDIHLKFIATYNAFGSINYKSLLVELKNAICEEGIEDLTEFICISKRFSTDIDDYYTPSSGEAKVIAFQKAIENDARYYLLDEPEKSLGNYYTTTVILPQIERLAHLGRCVVCTTHSANIAVLGMPYQTILKEYCSREYLTYVGNMYLNNLQCLTDSKLNYLWSDKSIDLLEGGEHAFSERSYAYAIK